jgi:NADPH-dependent glutamate synthase beta subunit-like oxidoreductase
VKIRQLKRFVLEYGRAQGWTPAWASAELNGHKVAVIGAGPAGMACAAELRKGGYDVTVFEKEATAGGKLAFGMPNYVLDKNVLAEEVTALTQQGVKFAFGKTLGKDFTIDSLKNDGFEAIFVAIGNGKKVESTIPGAENALDALEVLKSVNAGNAPKLAETVAVIGKGFAAMDAARTAIRLGAKHVNLLWPTAYGKGSADQEVLALAQEEGVVLLDSANVTAISADAVSVERGGIAMNIPCGQVIIANEYVADSEALGNVETKNGFVKIANGKTSIDGVYAGGNAVRGANVITAIAAGKNAAAVIDKDIRGEAATLEGVPATKTVNPEIVRQRTGYLKKDSNKLNLNAPASERISGFENSERVMTEEEAQKEASRCLNCGCGEGCQLCKTICTDFAPEIIDADTMHIRKEECVACGMCFNRCPNGNIEMVDLGYTV